MLGSCSFKFQTVQIWCFLVCYSLQNHFTGSLKSFSGASLPWVSYCSPSASPKTLSKLKTALLIQDWPPELWASVHPVLHLNRQRQLPPLSSSLQRGAEGGVCAQQRATCLTLELGSCGRSCTTAARLGAGRRRGRGGLQWRKHVCGNPGLGSKWAYQAA